VHGRTLSLGALFAALACAPAQAVTVADCTDLATQLGNGANSGGVVTMPEGMTCEGSYPVTIVNLTLEGAGTGATFNTTAAGRALSGSGLGNLVLRNLTFTSPTGDRGGVELTGNTTADISDVQFVHNGANEGGGLRIDSTATTGEIVIRDSVFGTGPLDGNTASTIGGAASIVTPPTTGAPVELRRVTMRGNTLTGGPSVQGGALSATAGKGVTLADSTLTGNSAGPAAMTYGGAAILGGSSVTVTGTRFADNVLRTTDSFISADGGALFMSGSAGQATLTGNTFENNAIAPPPTPSSAGPARGGAAAINTAATLQGNVWIQNSMPTAGNVAGGGGALWLTGSCSGSDSGQNTLRNELFRANTGRNVGGAVAFSVCGEHDTFEVVNSTFRENTVALGAGGAALYAAPTAVTSVFNSVLWNDTGAAELTLQDATKDVRFNDACNGAAALAGDGNICADPLFADGSSAVVQANSPVIDRGSNALVPADLTTSSSGGARILDGDGVCSAVVDMGAAEAAEAACVPAAPPAGTPPVTTPPVTSPPLTDPGQVLLCAGRTVALVDLRRRGGSVALRGLTLASRAGKRVRVTADHGGGHWTAKVARDGSFALKVPKPKSSQTSYTARYGKDRSAPLKVTRNLTIVSRKKVAGGLRVVARHSKGRRVAGEKATIRRQTGCNTQVTAGTAKFDKRGRITTTLPAPTGADTIAVYRITAKTNNTFTLPIVVRR
jgi:hypothetical protein